MKKSLLIAAAMIVGSSIAMASANLTFKGSYLNQTSKTGATETNSSYMAPEVALVDLQGKVGEAEYRLLLDFYQLHIATAATGGNTKFMNEIW